MTDKKKQERFDKLFRQYAIAFTLTNSLLDSGLLDRKIKVTENNFGELRRSIIPAMAADLRNAEANSASYNYDKHDKLAIIDAYFDELGVRGREWEYADLQDYFAHERSLTEQHSDDF